MAYLLLDPAVPSSIPSIPRNCFQRKKFVDAAKVNQQRCSEESGQWLENVDRTHLVTHLVAS